MPLQLVRGPVLRQHSTLTRVIHQSRQPEAPWRRTVVARLLFRLPQTGPMASTKRLCSTIPLRGRPILRTIWGWSPRMLPPRFAPSHRLTSVKHSRTRPWRVAQATQCASPSRIQVRPRSPLRRLQMIRSTGSTIRASAFSLMDRSPRVAPEPARRAVMWRRVIMKDFLKPATLRLRREGRVPSPFLLLGP
ncbi:MAG: hypothetical protein BWY44_00212 [Candidatus Omnitrophica bacterium ADurb.Bin292]|nr:MAG: hypothetical protein BWY44_00212 [Candidatus Omnitrophica bacterium ADurb.Bin292]